MSKKLVRDSHENWKILMRMSFSHEILMRIEKLMRIFVRVPCPGVPGMHFNADGTVSMTAALLRGAGASPVHKVRGCSADHGQIEDHAHAQRHALETLLWLKNGAHGRPPRSFNVYGLWAACPL